MKRPIPWADIPASRRYVAVTRHYLDLDECIRRLRRIYPPEIAGMAIAVRHDGRNVVVIDNNARPPNRVVVDLALIATTPRGALVSLAAHVARELMRLRP